LTVLTVKNVLCLPHNGACNCTVIGVASQSFVRHHAYRWLTYEVQTQTDIRDSTWSSRCIYAGRIPHKAVWNCLYHTRI